MNHNNLVLLLLVVSGFSVSFVENKYIGAYYWSGALKKVEPHELNGTLLTHLYYAFLSVNVDGSFTIQQEDKGYVEDLLKLKTVNPDLKLLFSVVDNNGTFSTLVANETLRQNFVKNALEIVSKHNYDGFDIDWEFPKDKDKENYISLLKELSEEFRKNDYQVTAAVRAIPICNNTGYIVTEMAKYLDIINIMTYDYYGSWSNTTGENSPLYPSSLDSDYEREYLNVNASIHNWVEAGAPKGILAVGIPFYGRTFTLADPLDNGIHAASTGGGSPLAPTYYQILGNYSNYTTVWNEEQLTPYKYQGTTWLSYDDEQSVEEKIKYALENELIGVFLWHLGGDDVFGEFSLDGQRQPLLQHINDVFVS